MPLTDKEKQEIVNKQWFWDFILQWSTKHNIKWVDKEDGSHWNVTNNIDAENELLEYTISIIETKIKETEKKTIENIKVDFLRQFLNESPDWKGKMFTNEDLIGFIKIAYKGE